MAPGLPELSLREKVLLWVTHVDVHGGDEPGLASTQAGIADATGLSRGHVSRTIAPLLEAGLLKEERRRVAGFSRVLKGYNVTPAGREEHDKLARSLSTCEVEVRTAGVGPEKMLLGHVVERQIGGPGIWPVVKQALEFGYVERAARRTGDAPVATKWLRDLDDAPGGSLFQGRENEVGTFSRWMKDPSALFLLDGHGGVGKTTLVAEALRGLNPKRHILWVRITEWMTGPQLVERLDAALARVGHSPRGPVPEEPAGVRAHLERRLRDVPLVLVLDDAQKAEPLLRRTIEGVVRCARGGPAMKVVVISRAVPLPADLVRAGKRLHLEGVDEKAALQLLEARGVPAAQRESIVTSAQGNPLFLELLASTPDGSGRGLDLYRYVASDLAADLSSDHRELLKWASALRTPEDPPFWERLGVGSPAAVDELCQASLLKRRDDGRVETHDVVREAFYAQIPYQERRMIHSRLASAYRPGSDLRDMTEYLHHLVRSGRRPEAVRWVLRNRTRLMSKAHRMFRAGAGGGSS